MARLNKEKTIEALNDLGVEIPERTTSYKELTKLLKDANEKPAERISNEDSGQDDNVPTKEQGDSNEDDSENLDKMGEDSDPLTPDPPADDKSDDDVEDNERLQSDSEKGQEAEEKAEEDKDYLLKYQYGQDDNGPMKYGDPRSNPAVESKAHRMKEHLLKQERIKIMIPKADGEDPTVRLSVNLNGYRLDFPKNTYLEVPEQMANVIMDSQKQQSEALQPFRIDRNKKTEDVLG